MKTKLIAIVLSAAIIGGSNAALARGKESKRYEQPRVQHTQQRDWGKHRQDARGHRNVHRDRHFDRRVDRHVDRHVDRRVDRHRGHGRGWSRHQPRYRHGWSHRNHHGRYARHGRHYPHARGHGHAPARPYHHSINGLSIILHGHF